MKYNAIQTNHWPITQYKTMFACLLQSPASKWRGPILKSKGEAKKVSKKNSKKRKRKQIGKVSKYTNNTHTVTHVYAGSKSTSESRGDYTY